MDHGPASEGIIGERDAAALLKETVSETSVAKKDIVGKTGDEPDGLLLSRQVSIDNSENDEREKIIEPYSPRPDGFNMILVSGHFEKALELSEDVDLHHYLIAYRELERFFGLMGTIFGFVGADVKDKIEILAKHQVCEKEGGNYVTLRSMMIYETAVAERLEPFRTPNNSKSVSASRTVLRLHRALEFIMLFMDALIEAEDDHQVAGLAQESYNKSLAKYHGWFIRKSALLAMNFLPNKISLMERISRHSYSEVTDIARRMTSAMKPVHSRTEALYTEFMLHELP